MQNISGEILKRQDCQLLLVDIQKVMQAPCVDGELLKKHAAALIDVAHLMEIPVIFTTQNASKLGGFLPELLEKDPSPKVLDKTSFSCFKDENIAKAIQVTRRKTLLLAGLEAHVCIFHTGVHALHLGYKVHVAADAVSSRSELNRQVGLRRLERAGAVISSTEMMIYELLGRSGSDEFRAALPLLKTL
jgi:nicotinamidase-related amidase